MLEHVLSPESMSFGIFPVIWENENGEKVKAYAFDFGAATDEPATICDATEGRIHFASNDDLRIDPEWLAAINRAYGRAKR